MPDAKPASPVVRYFLPGLVLGAVLGGVVATLVPEFTRSDLTVTPHHNAPGASATQTRDGVVDDAINDAQNAADDLVEDAETTAEDLMDQGEDLIEDATEAVDDTVDSVRDRLTPPGGR